MRRTLSTFALAATLLLGGVPHLTHAAGPGGRVLRAPEAAPEVVKSWTLTPASGAGDASPRPNLSYELQPGAVQDDAVTLFNLGNTQMTFRVYATDAFTTADGQFSALPGDQEPSDVGSWVTLTQEFVTVAAGTQITIPLTVTVPKNAEPGDHAGAVLVSEYDPNAGTSADEIMIDQRTGTRLYLRVAGDLRPQLAVTHVDASYDQSFPNPFGGSVDLTYVVENRGNVRAGAKASLDLSGPFGLGGKTVDLAEVPDLLPGERLTVSTKVSGVLAAFLLSAEVTLRPVDPGSDHAIPASSSGDSTFAPPVMPLVVVLLLILAVLVRRATRRARSRVVMADLQRA